MPRDTTEQAWKPLEKLVGTLAGNVSSHPELKWQEGIGIRLDWADDRLWLLFEPRTIFDDISDLNRPAAADFARERTIKRYNRQLNSLLEFWSEQLAQEESDLRAFAIGDGIDAVFRVSAITGFSRRSGA